MMITHRRMSTDNTFPEINFNLNLTPKKRNKNKIVSLITVL